MNMQREIEIFIHIQLDEDNVIATFHDYLRDIEESGLMTEVSAVNIGIAGCLRPDLGYLPDKVKIVTSSPSVSEFDFETVRKIHQRCTLGSECYILFLRVGRQRKTIQNSLVVTSWRDCIKRLDSGIDICGTRDGKGQSPEGWWANSNYIRSLGEVPWHKDATSHKRRVWAEKWLHQIKKRTASIKCQYSRASEISEDVIPPPISPPQNEVSPL